MSFEFIDELEDKINGLIATINREREEKSNIQNDLNGKNGRIGELEQENGDLRKQLEEIKTSSSEYQSRMDSASDKIRNIISRLESVA